MMWLLLEEFLMEEVNRRISPKMSMQFEGNERGYFALRAEIEAKIILETAWLGFWQNCEFLEEPLENFGFQRFGIVDSQSNSSSEFESVHRRA